MNVGPILRRELIEQSRRPDTHLLRVAGGGFIALFLWSALGTAATADAGSGRGLFLALNKLLFALLWMVGPVMTADCLSREKREGTIGLLFLTPLRPVEIVLG
jgi:hypothetical protein